MTLEKIKINKELFDFSKVNILDFSQVDFLELNERLGNLNYGYKFLQKLISYPYFSYDLELFPNDIEVSFDFSDNYSYYIYFNKESHSLLEVISNKDKQIFIKDLFGNYSYLYTQHRQGQLPESEKRISLAIQYFEGKTSEIFKILCENLYIIDLKKHFNNLCEIKNEIPLSEEEFLGSLIELKLYDFHHLSCSLDGFIYKNNLKIPYNQEGSGLKKLSWIYPWLWMSKNKNKKIIFYNGFFNDSFHPLLTRALLNDYKKNIVTSII